MRIRTLIVDDEPLARRRLRAFLRPEGDVEIAGECGNGAEAVEAIRQHKPQLVFLDVQMPGMDGFEVLRALEPNERPLVVFVTAHDQYAVQAFEERALDYLLKPFAKRRFEDTMARVRERIERPESDDARDRCQQPAPHPGTAYAPCGEDRDPLGAAAGQRASNGWRPKATTCAFTPDARPT